jgi:hypothetical protein
MRPGTGSKLTGWPLNDKLSCEALGQQPLTHGLHKKERPEVPEGTAGRPRTGYSGGEEFTSSFFFPWPPRKLKRLRVGLASSGFYSQKVCGHLVHQRERCKSAESRITSCSAHRRATAMWTRHAIGLVSPSSKTIYFRVGSDSIGRVFSARKRGISYPQR